MIIPKGNVLIEDVELPFAEVEPMLSNLQADCFTGYVSIVTPNAQAYIFMSGGDTDKALEVDNASGNVNVYEIGRLLKRLINKQLLVSTYVMSAAMVKVLGGMFAFQQQYVDYDVKRREMKKVLEGLDGGVCSGMIKVASREDTYFLIVSGGQLLTDRFSRRYGQVICGVEEVKMQLERIDEYGASITVYAEKDEEIEEQRRQKDDELEKIKDLMIRPESGFGLFRSSDLVKVDEYVVREWGIDSKSAFNVEVENKDGEVFEFKCQATRRMGGYAGVTKAMMERMHVVENEIVSIHPV